LQEIPTSKESLVSLWRCEGRLCSGTETESVSDMVTVTSLSFRPNEFSNGVVTDVFPVYPLCRSRGGFVPSLFYLRLLLNLIMALRR
jgi:hypothetical protein